MSIAPPGYRTRLTVFTLLACGGLLATSTAATVIAAGETQRRLAAGHRPQWALGYDPSDPRLLRIAGDASLSTSARFLALQYVVEGVCLREREVIFGPSAQRHRAVDTLLWAMRDVPSAGVVGARHHRMLNDIQNNARALHTGKSADARWSDALMQLILPGSANSRMDWCRTLGT